MTAFLGGHIGGPNAMAVTANSATFNTFQLDASNDALAWIFQAEEDATIDTLGFRIGARTGTPPTYRASLQAVSGTTSVPDGTVLGGGTPASATFTPPASAAWDATFQWITLDNSYAVTRGTVYAVVVEYSSGTIDASNRISGVNRVTTVGTSTSFPYAAINTAGTWSRTTDGLPVFGYKSASHVYGFPVQSYYTANTAATNGHRSAMKFNMPTGYCSTYKVRGINGQMMLSSATGQTFKIGIWDAAGTMIQELTHDSDILSVSPATSRFMAEFKFDETSLTALSAGTDYYFGIEVASSSAVGAYGWVLSAAGDRDAFPFGAIRNLATWNGSAWTDTTTVLPMLELVIDDWTVAAGGGSTPYVIGS